MHEFLLKMIGRRLDVNCGPGSTLRGEVIGVEDGVLVIKEDDQLGYVSIDKIIVVWEVNNDHEHRAGFVPAV